MNKILYSILTILFITSIAYGAVENFSTYTEVDSAGDITVTSSKCDVSSMRRDANSSVYKDFSAGYFGQFTHYVTSYLNEIVSPINQNTGVVGFYHISNTSAATYQDIDDANVGLIGYWRYVDVPETFIIAFRQSSDSSLDEYNAAEATVYYLTIQRTADANTLKIYSDSGRTNLLDTLTVSYSSTTYRYIGPIASRDATPTATPYLSFYSENLDLNISSEVAAFGQLIFVNE